MKPKLLLVPVCMTLVILLAFRLSENKPAANLLTREQEYKNRNIVRCSPDWKEIKDWIDELDIPPLPGCGTHKWKITTNSDSAQFYFNQGINTYYGFSHYRINGII